MNRRKFLKVLGIGAAAVVVAPKEILAKATPKKKDYLIAGNPLPSSYRYTVRTTLPSLNWRKLNEGINIAENRRCDNEILKDVVWVEGYPLKT